MGNRFCCAQPTNKLSESSPIFTQNRYSELRKEQRQQEMLESLRKKGSQTAQSVYKTNGKVPTPLKKELDKCKLKFIEAFSVSIGDAPVKFLSFSQRKYVGFRQQYEFDRKRLIIASETAFCIIGYDIDEKPQELISTSVSDQEIILYIGFIDDEKPQFVLLITRHTTKGKVIIRMLKIKKENDRSFSDVIMNMENQKNVETIVKQELENGRATQPRTAYDNYNVYLDSDLEQFKKDQVKPYLNNIVMASENLTKNIFDDNERANTWHGNPQQANQNNFAMNSLNNFDDDIDFQPDQIKTEGDNFDTTMSGATDHFQLKLPLGDNSANSSFGEENEHKLSKTQPLNPLKSIKGDHIAYQIYEINEQILKSSDLGGTTEGFKYSQYFNYSQFKKFVFSFTADSKENSDKLFFSYIINHRLHNNVSQNNSFAGANKSQMNNSAKSIIQNKEPILINTHHTQYYGKVLNNNYHYKKTQVKGNIRGADFAYEKLYAIYENNLTLDVFNVNGIITQSYDIQECFNEHDLTLKKLTYVQVPMLKWSTRQLNLQGFGQPSEDRNNPHLQKIILVGQVNYSDQVRNFLMIFNLDQGSAEIIKIIDLSDEITCINYGPYDNGHILVGLSDGKLIAFDFLTLERLETVKIFDNCAINCITFDPTNYIFVGGDNGKTISLSYIDKKLHYLYLDLGKNKFCTVQLPRNYTPDVRQSDRVGYNHLEGASNFCCV